MVVMPYGSGVFTGARQRNFDGRWPALIRKGAISRCAGLTVRIAPRDEQG